MKEKFTIISILLVSFLMLTNTIFAQTEEEPSPSPDDEVIKQKVEERIEKVLSDAEEGQKQALVGTLKEITSSTLTIETLQGDFQAKVDPDATIINPDRETIELEDLEIGDKIIAMGYLGSNDVLEAKRIVVIENFQTPVSEAVFGIVTDISLEEKVLTIKNPKDETVYAVEMDAKVKITKNIKGEIETIKFEDIEKDDHLVVVGEPGENAEKMITAKLIHVISGEATTIEKEIPSPSPLPEEEE